MARWDYGWDTVRAGVIGVAVMVKQVGRVALGDHVCLPYGTDDELRSVLARFIVDGLGLGDKVLYVSDTAVPEAMTIWLRSMNIDSGPAWARGQLQLCTAREMYSPFGRFEVDAAVSAVGAQVTAARQAGYKGLRLMTEMSWVLGDVPGSDQLVEFEHRVQAAYDTREVAGICQYDRRRFSSESLTRHAAAHAVTVEPDALLDGPDLRITRTFAPRGLRVTGTVDRSTCEALRSVLERWFIAEGGDIHMDMAGLHFIDVAGIRVLVEAARTLDGRALRLVHLAPMLRQVIGLVGWGDTPGLVLTDDEAVPA